jgi:hypothetical protein
LFVLSSDRHGHCGDPEDRKPRGDQFELGQGGVLVDRKVRPRSWCQREGAAQDRRPGIRLDVEEADVVAVTTADDRAASCRVDVAGQFASAPSIETRYRSPWQSATPRGTTP